MARKRSERRRAAPPAAPTQVEPHDPSVLWQWCATAVVLAVYLGFLAHPIDLTISDLGRHWKNGELLFQSGFISDANLYAYTTPNQPFVNHHWGSGALFYAIERAFGFVGLSWFFLAVSGATLLIFFRLAARYGHFALALILAVVVMPILITRHEIRPELFSYFLSGLYWQILWGYRDGRYDRRWLWVLPVLQIFWVNLHVYFFIGLFIVGIFWLESLVKLATAAGSPVEARVQWKPLAVTMLVAAAASCVNPAGPYGAIYPFLILQGYEFPVIENYSVPAILQAGFRFLPLTYFLIIGAVLGGSWLYLWFQDRTRFSLSRLIFTLFFFALAWLAIRNAAMFAFFALPLAATNLRKLCANPSLTWFSAPGGSIIAAGAAALVLVLISPAYFFAGGRGAFGVGLKPGNLAALEFWQRAQLQGPIFNNFDVGGYLIFGLHPQTRVYVDNRPEAYPSTFFSQDYFALIANEEAWRRAVERHGFNLIVINPRGRSATAENFILRRLHDPSWAAIFFDHNILILARRHGPNQSAVAKYELARDALLQSAP